MTHFTQRDRTTASSISAGKYKVVYITPQRLFSGAIQPDHLALPVIGIEGQNFRNSDFNPSKNGKTTKKVSKVVEYVVVYRSFPFPCAL